jgi:gamma-polyglutamate biosynthesis protein CapC
MMELLPVSVGIGLGVGFLLSEFFGLTSVGLVVPGYIALHLTDPLTILLTLASAFSAFALIQALSSFMILYGRRRIVLLVLAGYLMGMVGRFLVDAISNHADAEFFVIGFIIPGLIAIWFDRRGVLESCCSLIISSVIVRLILVVLLGSELMP